MTADLVANRPIIERPSPNHDARPDDRGPVDTLVLHYTGMVSADAALDRMTDSSTKVSAHWCIGEDGTPWRLVSEQRRAWHAGLSHWRGRSHVNDFSIGIELVNPGHEFGYRRFPSAQMDTVIALCREICARHPIKHRNVVAHSDVAPLRKEDPGELFEWKRLAMAGVGQWPNAVAMPVATTPVLCRGDQGDAVRHYQRRLRTIGYEVVADGDFGETTEAVVTAFQRHYRQACIDGVIDAATAVVIGDLSECAETLDDDDAGA